MKSRDIKRTAREALRGNRFRAFIASVIFGMFSTGGSISLSYSVESPEGENDVIAMLSAGADAGEPALEAMLPIFFGMFVAFFIYNLIMFIVRCGVGVGYAQFNLDIIDGEDARIGTLFSCFDRLKTAVWAKILVAIRILLGLILFVVPGIMAIYGCSMVNYIIADNPDATAREAIRESRRIMKGNRWRLFCLELSFILPILLSVLTLGIGFIWVIPRMQASYAAFYREIS